MCAEFMLRASNQKILRSLGVPVKDIPDEDWDLHAKLYTKAPVILKEEDEVEVRPMSFSLKPRDVPYPTFNARLLSWDEKQNKIVPIYDKPTWREPLRSHRCLVPMNGFIEPVYSGDHAGEMVLFRDRENQVMFCPGLYAEGVDKKTGETYEGFTLILHVPSPFVLSIGHHRQPVFLKAEDARRWIESRSHDDKAAVNFLLKHRHFPELEIEKSRTMAKGWEKRVGEYERKLATEMKFMEKLEG